MDDKAQGNGTSSISGSIFYFSFVVLISSLILWIFSCLAIKLDDIPFKQLPESLLYPILVCILIPGFLNHIVGKCLKSIPLGKYTKALGIFLAVILALFLVVYVGMFDITFVKGTLLG